MQNGCEVIIDTRVNEKWNQTFYGASCKCDSVGIAWLTPEKAVRKLNCLIELQERLNEDTKKILMFGVTGAGLVQSAGGSIPSRPTCRKAFINHRAGGVAKRRLRASQPARKFTHKRNLHHSIYYGKLWQ